MADRRGQARAGRDVHLTISVGDRGSRRVSESSSRDFPKLSVHETPVQELPVLTFPTYHGFPARLSSERSERDIL